MGLTSRGVGVLLLAVSALAGGLLLRLPELVALAVGLGLLVMVSLVAVAASTTVDVVPPGSTRVERDQPATLDVTLLDHGSRSLSGMRMRSAGSVGPAMVGLPRLLPGIPSRVSLPIPTERRGPLEMGPWTVERVDAWLLVRRRVTWVPAVEVVVVPRVHPAAVAPLLSVRGERARSRSRQAGEGEVSTLREYVVGDEVRRVHWRSSAKVGTLMVTQHVDSRRPGVHVLLDVSVGSYASDAEFEEAIDAAASIAVSAALTGVEVDLTTTGGDSARAGGGRHAGVLDLLARVGPSVVTVPASRFEVGSVVAVTGSRRAAVEGWGAHTLVKVGVSGERVVTRGLSVVPLLRASDLAAVPRSSGGPA